MIKLALIGYGRMGKMVELAALCHGHSIVTIIDPKQPTHTKISEKALAGVDVCIDFSRPECSLENLKTASGLGISVVNGVTGWDDHLCHAKEIVEASKIGFLYSANFSLGAALFQKMIEQAAKMMAPFSNYDVSGIEIHHNQKLDSPSGTAKTLSRTLETYLPHKGSIPFSSVRVGHYPGTHSVIFDSPIDTITLTHAARNREGFADGAVHAAAWLHGKKGFFTLNDMFM